GEIRALESFAAADVDDVGVGRRDRDGADGSGRLVVEDRRPDAAVIRRLPHAAVHGGDVEDVGLRRDAGCGFRAPAAERPDVAPAELLEEVRLILLGARTGPGTQDRTHYPRTHQSPPRH